MPRSLVFVRAAALSLAAAVLTSCMALPKADRTMFQEPPLLNRGTLPLKAAIVTLRDARPDVQRRASLDIEDFPARITLELMMDLSEARLFSSIGQDTKGADVILRGEVRALTWKPRYDWAPYVPALGILAAFGVPVAHSNSDVELGLDVVSAKTDQVIASYTKAASRRQSYWVYRYQDFTAGSDRDVDSAFRQVTDELQT